MTITITAEERDALYEEAMFRLNGIGEVWLMVEAKKFGEAARLGRVHCDLLLLLLNDLGFGRGSGVPVELTTPPEVLSRVLGELRERAEAQAQIAHAEQVEAAQAEASGRLVVAACTRVLAQLGRPETDCG